MDNPLKRIQDEINEVARRERELREKTQRQQQQAKLQQQTQQSNNDTNNHHNHHHHLNNHSTTNGTLNNHNSSNNNSLNSTISSNDETPSTNTSLSPIIANGKDTNLDVEHHSDDSGISASSSPIPINVKKYIRSNNYNVISPTPPPQLLLNRPIIKSVKSNNNISDNNNNNSSNAASVVQNGNATMKKSTSIHFTPIRRITTGPAHKGLMQRFIATRGKISLNNGSANHLNGMNGNHVGVNGVKDGPLSPIDQFHQSHRNSVFLSGGGGLTPPIIERDAEGKPLRRGYVPVEEKIQKELKDIKSRESELKRIRRLKTRQSQPDLLESIENEFAESDDDSDVEHCYPPGKLRAVKSISELCDSMNSSSLSPSRTTPSPNFERSRHNGDTLRPAVSLAQLCDLDNDKEAPSSHELIAKWESLIQQNS